MSLNTGHTRTRRAAEYIADLCVAGFEARLQMPVKKAFSVTVEFDSVDVIVSDDTSNLKIIWDAHGAQIPHNDLQEVEIDLEMRASVENASLEVDSYMHTSGDPEMMRNAIIKINAYMPTDFRDSVSLREEIVAAITHELRHAIQFILWKIDKDPVTDEESDDVESHLMCPYEIDARVEEICTYTHVPLHTIADDEFESLAKKYLWGYIKRNFPFDVDLEIAVNALKSSLKLHVDHFRVRRDCDEFTNPIV